MKTSFCNKLFLSAAALAVGILGGTTAQAQLGGVPLWTNLYNGPANDADQARALAVDAAGKVFVTGQSDHGNAEGVDYATIAYSGTGVPLWTNRYNGPANYNDVPNAVAVDGSGNVFVTGFSGGSGSFDDYATIAYSSSGVALWTNRYNGPANGYDQAQAVAVDGSGNVFVTGSSTGSGSGADYVTIAYSSAGLPLWTNRYVGPGTFDDSPYAIAVDGSGNVFVTGQSRNPSGFPISDFATIKYSGAGVPLWTNRYNGTQFGFDYAQAVAVDANGNVFVTGQSGQSPGFPTSDFATIKYSGSGVPLWTNRYNGTGNGFDQADAVAVDSSGNVFVIGLSSSFGSGSDNDYATIKYSGAGVPLWTNRYDGAGNSDDQARALAVDGSGNVFVTGYACRTNNGYYDFTTIAYSSAGVPLWTNRYDGPGNRDGNRDDYARALAVDGNGNVFVTGHSWNDTHTDFATVKYSSAIPPSLTITRTTTNTVTVSWPFLSTGFTLQENTNGIETVNWSNVVTMPSDDGTTRTVIVNPPTGNRFYRLFHP